MERILADRFVVERAVGAGGMGEVFRAVDRLTGGIVAVKVLFGSQLREAERFKREGQILAEIAHPRIVKYVAHGFVEGGRPFLAMEWLDGEDLSQRLERRGLTLRETLTLARRACEALSVLHDKRIVHRDIKPSNLFLPKGSVDELKLLDLGVARLLRSVRPATLSGVMVGTPGYMAPEQARGAKEIDTRADIFALGCVLYECLAGQPAFAGENIAGLLAKILLETPVPLRELGVDVPAALDDLVSRMLSKHPASRPGSGAAVLKELEAFESVDDAPPHRVSAPTLRAITGGERRLVCIVMAAVPATDDRSPEALETIEASFDPRTVAASFGAEAEILADGSLLVLVTGKGSASDQAAQAARCALALRSHLIEANVVLATGLAMVTGRSAVGDVIERAASLLASACTRTQKISEETFHGNSPVFLDETTAGLLDTRFDVGGDGRGLFIRGLRDRDARARTLLGKATPFVGRERELTTLLGIFDECVDEPVARAVLVTGFPGAGKSRLVGEFLNRIRERPNVEIAIARGDAMSGGSPFALVSRLIRRSCGITDAEALVVRQQKLRARVARNVREPDVTRVTEFLGEIASIPFSDGDSVQLRAARHDATLMGDQMRRAFCDFVVAEAGSGAFVIIVEDLHWGDLPSVNLLDAALRDASDRSFLVLAVARGDVHDAFPRLWAQRSLQEVRLGPLVRRAGERLVREILGDTLDDAEIARLLDRAAGNAFYLEELIRAYAEADHTKGPGDASWVLPTTVLAMVEARLGRLDPMARRVLRAASVFGESFWRGGVLTLLGNQYRTGDVDDWLAELARREIVQRREHSRFPADVEYRFRHAIVRDAAYQMLTADDQALGHRLAAEWLVASGEHDPMALAEHFERGGVPDRAAEFYSQAALQALEGNDFTSARARATRGLANGAAGEERGRLDLVLAEASRWLGEHADAAEHARAALATLPEHSDDWYVAAAEAVESAITLGRSEDARATAERLLSTDVPMTTARVLASSRVAVALGVVGEYELTSAILAPIEQATLTDPAAHAALLAAHVARAIWEGELERAALLARESASSFELVGDMRNAARQLIHAGFALGELGAYAASEAVLRDARSAGERLGLATIVNDAALRLAYSYVRTNHLGEALRTAEEVSANYAAQGDRVGEGRARAYVAIVHYYSERHQAAEVETRRALALLEHSPPYRAALLAFMTLTLVLQGADPERIRSLGFEAMRLFEQVGGTVEGEAVIRLAYAEALNASGDREGTKKAITAARDRLLARAAKIKNEELRRTFLGTVREHMRTFARAGEWLV